MAASGLPWAEMLTSALSGGALTKAFDWLSSRGQSKAYTMGAVDHAVQTAMATVTCQLERTERRLEVVEDQHNECQTNLQQVRDELGEARAHIGRLMRGATVDA